MTTNAAVDVNALFSVKLAPIFQTNIAEMNKLKTQLQNYGTNPVRSWTKLFAECILAITNNRDAVERTNKYKPEFIGEIQIKYPKIDDFLNKLTKNEFVVLFAETLSTILQTEPLVEPVVEQKEGVPIVEETLEEKEARERFLSNQEAGRDMENGLRQVSYRNDFDSGSGSGGSQHKKTPRRRKYSKRNNTRRKRTVRKRRSYK
jgi:hypothetical protein